MSQTYRSARGERIDMDMIRLSNEKVIAIGNMRTNARGDELGAGGKVVKTKSQIMAEYHKLNTPIISDAPVADSQSAAESQVVPQKPLKKTTAPVAMDIDKVDTQVTKPRGNFAGAVAEQTEVKQELLEPPKSRNSDGVKRI